MYILVVVGSEMGTAEMVADLVRDELARREHTISLTTEMALDEVDLASRKVVLLITSTTGLGDVPQNLEPLYRKLVDERPDLSHLRYGLVGMGDRNYKETYCGGPRKMDAIFTELGAKRIGEALWLDANEHPMPDEDALAWLPSWLEALGSEAPDPEPADHARDA